MPKLPTKVAKTVEKSEQVSVGFDLLKPGRYLARLREVGVEEHQNYPDHVSLWVAQFENLHSADGTKHPGRQWYRMNVILNDNVPANYANGDSKWSNFVRMSNGQMKGFFENMGYTADSDTDEMIGEWACIDIAQRTIQKGARTGEKVNEVRGVVPVPDSLEDLLNELQNGAADDDADDSF